MTARPDRRAALAGLAAGGMLAGPAAAQSLGGILGQLKPPQSLRDLMPKTPAAPPVANIPAGLRSVEPKGYSERFLPVRNLVSEGHYDQALDAYKSRVQAGPLADNASKTAPDAGPFLPNAELGLIEFEAGKPDAAVTHFAAAEAATSRRTTGGRVTGAIGSLLGKAAGQEETGPYTPLDHEAILQLNYLALAYLLQGERRCYNVTRRCIDAQSDLKAKFDKELETYKAQYDQKLNNPQSVSATDRTSLDDFSNQFNAYDAIAGRVPNAYVNPLGDYLAGVIQEIVSQEQPDLRDNSRISYENALKLCGGSPQLASAAAAMARTRFPKEKVLHVIVGEGFSPSREVMTFGLALNRQVVPVRVPIFKPTVSSIERIELTGTGGKPVSLDPIGDFEAIRLRDQKDRIPQTMVGVFTTTLASYFEGRFAANAGAFGQKLWQFKESAATPDTRSWLDLPRRFYVARVVVPATAKSVELVAYGRGGRRVGAHTVVVSPDPQSILYARVTDAGLQAQEARKLWIEGGRLEETAA